RATLRPACWAKADGHRGDCRVAVLCDFRLKRKRKAMALGSNAKNFQRQPPYSRLPLLIILMAGITLGIGVIALHYLESRLVAAKGDNLASSAADIADKLDLLLYERYTDIQILAQNPVFQGNDTAAKN